MGNLATIQVYQQSIWDDKDLKAINATFQEDATIYSPLENMQGVQTLKATLQRWYEGFPDLKVHWDDYSCQDDKLVVRWHAEDTHQDEFLDLPATGDKIAYSGATIYQLENGKVVQYWAYTPSPKTLPMACWHDILMPCHRYCH